MKLQYSVLLLGILFSCAVYGEEVATKDLAALLAAAQTGNAQAQLEYAKAIREKSPQEAYEWGKKAAAQDLAEAWFWLGYASLGSEIPSYSKAAELGHQEAFYYLFDKLLFRAGNDADVIKAKKFADLARKKKIDLGYDTEGKLRVVDQCYTAGKPKIPVADIPTAEESKRYKKQQGTCFHYQQGIGVKRDLAQYRKCLLSQQYRDNNGLAEIYANGWGVKRDATLALALVCHGSSVPAELEGMVKTLYTTRNQAVLKQAFSFCDHVTSGMNGGWCSARAETIKQAKRATITAAITRDWSEAQRKLFQQLQKIAEDFWDTHSGEELDMSGTARASIAIAEESALRNNFLSAIRSFEKGKFPLQTGYRVADKELNRVYSRIMKKKKVTQYETVTITKQGIRKTQRKWLRYRDAFVKFTMARYPQTNKDTWLTWLTVNRTKQLEQLLNI